MISAFFRRRRQTTARAVRPGDQHAMKRFDRRAADILSILDRELADRRRRSSVAPRASCGARASSLCARTLGGFTVIARGDRHGPRSASRRCPATSTRCGSGRRHVTSLPSIATMVSYGRTGALAGRAVADVLNQGAARDRELQRLLEIGVDVARPDADVAAADAARARCGRIAVARLTARQSRCCSPRAS